jgi:hypothetical protein
MIPNLAYFIVALQKWDAYFIFGCIKLETSSQSLHVVCDQIWLFVVSEQPVATGYRADVGCSFPVVYVEGCGVYDCGLNMWLENNDTKRL